MKQSCETNMNIFSILPNEIKEKIFHMLNMSSRYNASLVLWEEMTDEILKTITSIEFSTVKNLQELENAGVLATAGKLNSINDMRLTNIDVSSVPIDIINNLTSRVGSRITLNGVKGWRCSMLENVKCSSLCIMNSTLLPSQANQPIRLQYSARLINIKGDVGSLLENLTCEWLDTETMLLNDSDTRKLMEMLSDRVTVLHVSEQITMDKGKLSVYDGQGRCEEIKLWGNSCFSDAVLWARSVGWCISKSPSMIKLTRSYCSKSAV